MSSQVWEDFPFLPAGASGVPSTQIGTLTSVPADGSAAVQVTYSPAYQTAASPWATIVTASAPLYSALSITTYSATLTGFWVLVQGGAPGSTVSVDWGASGT